MRRQFVAQTAKDGGAVSRGHLVAQRGELSGEAVDLGLLARDDLVERVQQVFCEARLNLESCEAGIGVGGFHRQYCLASVSGW